MDEENRHHNEVTVNEIDFSIGNYEESDRPESTDSYDSGQGNSPFPDSDMDDQLLVLDPDHPVLQRYQSALEAQLLKAVDDLDEKLREAGIESQQYERLDEEVNTDLKAVESAIAVEKSEIKKINNSLKINDEEREVFSGRLNERRKNVTELEVELALIRKSEKDEQSQVDRLAQDAFRTNLLLSYYESRAVSLKNQVSRDPKQRVEKYSAITKLMLEKTQADLERLNKDVEQAEEKIMKSEELYGKCVQELKNVKEESEQVSVKNRQLLTTWKSTLNALRMKEEKLDEISSNVNELEDRSLNHEERTEFLEKDSMQLQKELEDLTIETNILGKRVKNYGNLSQQIKDKAEVSKTKNDMICQKIDEVDKVRDSVEKELEAMQRKNSKEREKLCDIKARNNALQTELISLSKLIDFDNINARNESKCLEELKMKGITLELECARIENLYSRLRLEVETAEEERRKNQKILAEVDRELSVSLKELATARQVHESKLRDLEIKQAELERLKNKHSELQIKMEERKDGEGPRRVRNLEAELSTLTNACKVLQEAWLGAQTHMMKLEAEREKIINDKDERAEKCHVLDQKRVMVTKQIEEKLKNLGSLSKELNLIRDNLKTINDLISSADEVKEQELIIFERQLLEPIDGLEQKVLNIRKEISNLEQEKIELKSQIYDNDRLIKLWNSRLKEAMDTRHMLSYEQGDCGELAAMKESIHRLEAEKMKLFRHSEEFSKVLEKSVARRAILVTKADLRKGKPDPSLKARDTLLKNTFYNLQTVIARYDEDIERQQSTHSGLRTTAEATREKLTAHRSEIEGLVAMINAIKAEKTKNIRLLSLLQRRYKLFTDSLARVKEREFPPSESTKPDRYEPSQEVIEKLVKASAEVSDLANRVGTAIRENPQMAESLRPVLDLLLETY